MTNSQKYFVPNYYPQFSCKGPDCRHSCCIGWDVTISMNEYYILQGLECSDELKARLEQTFAINPYPSKECFAKLAKNEHDDCPLHLENGYCLLHAECGEVSLPAICQYYP